MSYTALYRKFRPQEFEDVKGQEHIVTPKGTSSCIGVLPGHWKLGFWIADLYHCLLKSTGFYMFVYLFFHYDSCFSVRRTK